MNKTLLNLIRSQNLINSNKNQNINNNNSPCQIRKKNPITKFKFQKLNYRNKNNRQQDREDNLKYKETLEVMDPFNL